MRTIISTVGTSLISNWRRANPGSEATTANLRHSLNTADLVKAAAETNALSRLIEKGDRLVFVCSETEEGRLCAEVLANFFKSRGHDTKVEPVPGLTYTQSEFRNKGLRGLVSVLCACVRDARRRGAEPLINGTGGFKPEVAYAAVVGMLLGVTVAYIHERINEIVIMPPVPIAWDFEAVADNEDLLVWLDEEVRTAAEVQRRMPAMPADLAMLVSEEPDGTVVLSVTGSALLEAYREARVASASVTVRLSSAVSSALGKMDAEKRRAFEAILQKLRIRQLWRGRAAGKYGSDCLGWPQGHVNERCLFFEDDGGVINVCEVGPHDAYDQMLKKGVYRKDYSGWTELPYAQPEPEPAPRRRQR